MMPRRARRRRERVEELRRAASAPVCEFCGQQTFFHLCPKFYLRGTTPDDQERIKQRMIDSGMEVWD